MTRKKEINKLGPRVVTKKNPFLKPDGGFDLIEKFPGIDYMPYESKRKRKKKR
ncbi:unnamed protein product [marine sediment metagenome]|uniref:Uncharacterized protein n=1 Tax=marine sediment metagenome TaxID=412755 RepID=X1QG02_9ZZZZ